MEEYHCLDLKFKDSSISIHKHHAHLYVKNDKIFIRIFIDKNNQDEDISRKFSNSDSALGFFDENFEIIESKKKIYFDKSSIWQVTSDEYKEGNIFFTIYLTNVLIIRVNDYKERINNGKVYLNSNGLKIVNSFYSFFTNRQDQNVFKIGRMRGMEEFYECGNLKFRPELEFLGNDKRNNGEFTIKRIPIINYYHENESFEFVREKVDIICKFLSFYYGIRINYTNLHYRTENEIYSYSNYDKLNHTYNSKVSSISIFLKTNFKIEQILKTNWYDNYISDKVKINKAIENYLHSREVDGSAKFLLLFSNIEIFNGKEKSEKINLNQLKDENFAKALLLIEESISDKEEINFIRNKWKWTIDKLITKPLGSPLENTLIQSGINAENFGFKFKDLKTVRNKLTHGSTSSINDEELKQYIYAMAKISISLILSKLGFKEELKTNL